MPIFTFKGLVSVIEELGFKPVFADIKSDTLTIDPEQIKKAITKKSKALLVVHNLGKACDMDEIVHICNKH